MITKLRVRNFKSLADTGELDIRPLTILVGPNSSGKSAVLQSLLLLRQTADSRDETNPLAISGDYVDLGSYQDLIYGHDWRRKLRIELSYRTQSRLMVTQEGAKPRVLADTESEIAFSLQFGYLRDPMRVLLEKARWAGDTDWAVEAELTDRAKGVNYLGTIRVDNADSQWKVERFKFYDFWRKIPEPYTGHVTTESMQAAFNLATLIIPLSKGIETLFQHLFYIGPSRDWPKRVYIASGQQPQDVGIRGELSVDVLWLQTRRKRTRERILGQVNYWMHEFGIAQVVKLTRLPGTPAFILNIVDPHSGFEVNIADVGFGASQVLPIIVEGFYCPPGSHLLMEQPEIHLHPRAQATLGDLLLAIVADGKTIVAETHSEHLISRVQRRIAEGKIKNDDVALYYCEATPEGTKIRRITLNDLGQFETEGLPEGFFEEGYLESMEHMKAIVSRAGSA